MNGRSAFHTITGLLIASGTTFVPFSFCAMVPIALMVFTFGLGRHSRKDGEEQEPPWLLLAYTACGMVGSVANLVFLFAIGGHK